MPATDRYTSKAGIIMKIGTRHLPGQDESLNLVNKWSLCLCQWLVLSSEIQTVWHQAWKWRSFTGNLIFMLKLST